MPQFHSSDQAGLLLTIYGEMKESLGRIEGKVDGQAEASEIRHKHLHKRIDKVEEKLEAKLERRPADTSPSSTSLFGTLKAIFKILEIVYTYWPRIVWVLTAAAAFWGIKNPTVLKLFSQTQP